MRMMGIREASALSDSTLRLVIGPSATDAADDPLAYRIISPDDPAYRYEDFVTPQGARASRSPELPLPAGFAGNRNIVSQALNRTIVELDLPTPMKAGLRYGVVAIGRHGEMITAAKTGAELIYRPAEANRPLTPPCSPDVMRAMGLRGISSIGNGIVALEFGHAVAAPLSTDPRNYTVTLNDEPCKIKNTGRRSLPDVYMPVGWPFSVFQSHEIYLELERPLADGDRIAITVAPEVTTGNRAATCHFDRKQSISGALKVNQVGYLPDAAKRVYLGRWLGSFPEENPTTDIDPALLFGELPKTDGAANPLSPSALQFQEPPEFELIEEKSGKCVLRKRATLRHNGSKPDGNINYSGENVYTLDFREYHTPGRYFVSVPGVGRSFTFDIAPDVYEKAFAAQAHGLFLQRCGQELREPYSEWRRIACHTSGVVPTTDPRYNSDSLWGKFLPYQLMRPNPDYPPVAQQKLFVDPSLVAEFGDQPQGSRELVFDPQQGFSIFFRFHKGTGTQKYGGDLLRLGSLRIAVSWGVWYLYAGHVHGSFGRIPANSNHACVLQSTPLGDGKYRTRLYVDGKLGAEVVSANAPGRAFAFGQLANANAADVVISGLRVYSRMFSPAEIALLCLTVPQQIPQRLMIRGGHHDAGDYNPRAHLDVAQKMMSVYEAAPRKFYDGQWNIPENANGLPDILDEALWALRLWIGMQREDGGVYDGTGSLWDVNFIQTVEMDDSGDYTWGVDAGASFRYAGAMAQAARILRKLRPDRSQEYLTRARRAYAWGSRNRPTLDTLRKSAEYYIAPRAYAAAELFRTTGEARYNTDFLTYTPWQQRPHAPLSTERYDLTEAAYSYVNLPDGVGDPLVKGALYELIRGEAEFYIKGSERMAYEFIKHPDAPIDWGTGAYETYIRPVWQMWLFSKDPRYFDWMVRTADNTLGANPLGICWITGLGSRSIFAPLHSSRYRPAGVAASGLQSQGPNARFNSYSCRESAWPPIQSNYAVLYNFADMHFAIGMNEGTTRNMLNTVALFGLLLPDR